MADQQVPEQYNEIYTLAVEAGIKRDGTNFESSEFTDGVWCRFQRGRPKKIGGYRSMFTSNSAIARGMVASPQNGVNYVFTGNSRGMEIFTSGTTLGQGSGPYDAHFLTGYSGVALISHATTQFVVSKDLTNVYIAGTKVCFAQTENPTIYTVLSSSYDSGTTQTTVTLTSSFTGTATTVYLADYRFTPNSDYNWQFDIQYSPAGGKLNLLASPGLNLSNIDSGKGTQIVIGGITPDANDQWNFTGLSDSAGQNPTYKPIVVDGGVCVLYPYIFVYGSNGYIANNHVDSANYATQSPYDWNGATANQVNMSSSKIVKGVPTRGGTNAPSGLFWATDSLIRVSFSGAAPLYWRYDIVSSQISIMSSNSVVEMDGVFYWLGVDRFYMYNGQVQVLPNDKNVNWLFDNLNYEQRQKVWATKVPRYNEIWFFYPRGTAKECTDAIIYNVKDKLWYDAGSAVGAQRSCGYTTEIFPSPIWFDWNYNAVFSQPYPVIETPSGASAPTGYQIYVQGNATNVFSPGSYASFANNSSATGFFAYDVITSTYTFDVTSATTGYTLVTLGQEITPPAEAGKAIIYSISGGYNIWQHEYGLNVIPNNSTGEQAIYSSITTSDISWIGGTPAGDTTSGANRRMHIRRIEPDFLQQGTMSLNILGRKFPNGANEEDSGPFYFEPNTGKIDLRIEHRLVRLQFVSNIVNGNYELGRNLITAEYGDERP